MRSNSRRFERVSFYTQIEVKDLSTGCVLPGRGIDVSRGGIGFFCRRYLAPGTPILIQIVINVGGVKKLASAKAIIIQARVEDGGAIMGAAFEPVLNPSIQPLFCDYVDRRY